MNKYIITLALAVLFLLSKNSANHSFYQKPVTLLSAHDFKNKMRQQPGIMIDVRTPSEFKNGSIEGAKLMNIFDDGFDAELAKLDRSKTYYVYCASGGRSAEATEKMVKMGFKSVYELDGGYSAWKKAGF